MKLLQCLYRWHGRPGPRATRPTTPDWVTAGSQTVAEALDEVLLGCGWFDSSHELHCGLQVTEHLTPERVVNEVPLGWWLDWQSGAVTPLAARGQPQR
jgi:hypothetical protein